MGNHYHIALETPEANLVRMAWLQGTFANRFHRFRGREVLELREAKGETALADLLRQARKSRRQIERSAKSAE